MSYDSAIIRIENLHVTTSTQVILKHIYLQIPRNKITVILGPSGCGKTTLLKCLNRLTDLYPQLRISGRVWIDDENIFDPDVDVISIRKKMGLLAQRPYPLPMSIYQNIAYGLKMRGINDRQMIYEHVQHYLKEVGLWEEVSERLHSPASKLSIGQQQRLCLARGLAVDPEIILADEPTSALDPISSRKIEEKFLELKSSYTLVIVTHILRQAKRLADHVIFMYLGEVIEQGAPEKVFEDPETAILKEYLRSGH